MALAIKFQGMIDRGEVRDYADLARLGYVTRARVTQIMNLLTLLAPPIQEHILRFGTVPSAESALSERDLRPVTLIADWSQQRPRLGTASALNPDRLSRSVHMGQVIVRQWVIG